MLEVLVNNSDYIDVIVKIIQGFTSVGVIIGLFIACLQLRSGLKSNRINILKSEFDIFLKISEAEEDFIDYLDEIENIQLDKKSNDLLNKKREAYYKALNLACLYVLERCFTKKHFLNEYKGILVAIYKVLENNNMLDDYVNIKNLVIKYKLKS
ncbi:hypothetical protein L8X52_06625 [Campylobacter lari]|uniref:hypothetical protein n=1 Tax=Campylobacter sp. RKI_CA19_01127 TaxID=2911628 RepID=UPI0021E6BB8B|nr:hypothetical protein [Campylobacter sp. RKI_CA19_01127]MCV3349818.1 hypothetical protein [Campylobacter sp. RKI_CA19_01127]MCV3501298.1 hypothetical protein [Campylobacter lari]